MQFWRNTKIFLLLFISRTHSGDNVLQLGWHYIYCVFRYIYSLLIDKDVCDRRNVLLKFPCVYMCLSSGDIFTFSVRVSSFFSYFYEAILFRFNYCLKITKIQVIHHKTWQPDNVATINYRNFGKIRNPTELRVI